MSRKYTRKKYKKHNTKRKYKRKRKLFVKKD